MIKPEIQDALNEQINAELYSGYLYLAMAAQFEDMNLGGMAGWMRAQAQEEVAHAMKLFGHVAERGGRVVLKAIDGPPTEWASPLAMFEQAYAHEQKVTALIDGLVKVAREHDDEAAAVFLQWFVSEQVEEEASADAVVQKLKRIQDSPQGLSMLDSALGKRGSE